MREEDKRGGRDRRIRVGRSQYSEDKERRRMERR
jgi:hypothetical protein